VANRKESKRAEAHLHPFYIKLYIDSDLAFHTHRTPFHILDMTLFFTLLLVSLLLGVLGSHVPCDDVMWEICPAESGFGVYVYNMYVCICIYICMCDVGDLSSGGFGMLCHTV
jgi:hypothetical protein